MKLATIKDATRDGALVVVSRDLKTAVKADAIAPTLQAAMDNWADVEGPLSSLSEQLNAGGADETFAFDPAAAAAPLPRAYQWADASSFASHGERMRRALKLDPTGASRELPRMYQGASDDFIGPRDDIVLPDEADDIDFEGEITVIVDDVPMGVTADDALAHIKLFMLINDVSLRAHARREANTGFGFLQSKPASSFAPVAVTPDEFGAAWRDGRVHLDLIVEWNGKWFGNPNASEMEHSFGELLAHAARTRNLGAGTIIGSGTVSNYERSVGCATITEQRAIELVENGQPQTPFMRFGDTLKMQILDADGDSVFGAIEQSIVQA